MRPTLYTKLLRNFSAKQPIRSPTPEPSPTLLPTEKMQAYLHKPTTNRYKKIRTQMFNQWILCLSFALFVYGGADDFVPGSWYSDNMFYDFHDKYPYRVAKRHGVDGSKQMRWV